MTPGAVPVDPEPLRELLAKAADREAAKDAVAGFPYPSDPEWNDEVAQAYELALQRLDVAHGSYERLEIAAVNALPDLLAEISALGSQLETLKQENERLIRRINMMVSDASFREGV